MTVAAPSVVTRAEVEDFLYREAALLDDWKLGEWEALLTDDAAYYVPPNCSSSPTTASASASASSASTIRIVTPNIRDRAPGA